MLKIGDFSKLAQVPVATLRYYDQLGLLKPARVDAFTDYRSYRVDQLPRLNRILALRDLGFSLDQIARLMQHDLSPDALRGMLEVRRADAEQAVLETQARLARVEARLRDIAREGAPPACDVVIKRVAPLWIVSTRQIVARMDHMGELCGRLHGQLRQWLRRRRIRPSGFPAPQLLNLYHNTEYVETDLDLEAAAVVGGPVQLGPADLADAPFAVAARQLEGAPAMACAIHRGPMDGLPSVIQALLLWVGANDYALAGPLREAHLAAEAEDGDPAAPVVEVQVPVAPG